MRRRALRTAAIALLVTILAAVTGACGDRVDDRDRLLQAVRRTSNQPLTFSYREETGGRKLSVEGVVEDDFRYAGRLSLDGTPLFEQVVADDSLGLRVLSPDQLPASALTPTPQADEALRGQSWVVDPVGAPALTSAKKRTGPVGGRDILAEAYDYLASVEVAISEAVTVHRYSDEALYYKPSEDPFPTPAEDSGVTRYDLERPRLPRATDGGGAGAAQRIPAERHFRKLSVYVKDGYVQRVLERVAFDEKLDDTLDYFESGAQSAGGTAVADFVRQARKNLGAGRRASVEQATLAAMNAARGTFGEDPIEFKNVEVNLRGIGETQPVAIPAEPVEATLTSFFKVVEEEAADGGAGSDGTGTVQTEPTTTTTAAPATEPATVGGSDVDDGVGGVDDPATPSPTSTTVASG